MWVVISNSSYPTVKNNNTAYHAFGKYWMLAKRYLNYRLKYCWPKVIYCICQPNEVEREIKKKTGEANKGPSKILWGPWPTHNSARRERVRSLKFLRMRADLKFAGAVREWTKIQLAQDSSRQQRACHWQGSRVFIKKSEISESSSHGSKCYLQDFMQCNNLEVRICKTATTPVDARNKKYLKHNQHSG